MKPVVTRPCREKLSPQESQDQRNSTRCVSGKIFCVQQGNRDLMTTDGVVQRRSQPFCKKGPLCLALIGCIVNSNSLGSKQPQQAKPQDVPSNPYSDDSIWPAQGHTCCWTSPYIYSECDSLCRLPRGDCKPLGYDLEPITLSAMTRPNPETMKRTRRGGPRGRTGCSTCR